MLDSYECKNVPVYEDVNRLIYEYLELNGLEQTLESFTSECKSKSLPCPPLQQDPQSKKSYTIYDAKKMMQHFDDGDLDGFLKLWKVFQTHIQVTSDDMRKLEVYIRVHFALWPRANGKPDEAQQHAMNTLKSFFEEHSATLAGDTSILPLFALPFVTDPLSHPLFKELFQDSWKGRLRGQLETTIMKYFDLLQKNICNHSKLAELIVKGTQFDIKTNELNDPQTYHQERFYKLLDNHRKIRKLLQGTRESYAKLLLVANELVTSLEKHAPNTAIPINEILQSCYEIFPEIFTPKGSTETKPDVEYFKALTAGAAFDPTEDSEVSLFFLGISDVSPDTLDYTKMKETLTQESGSPSDKLCLLQALRWMITKTDEKCRQFAIQAFVSNDLLGIRSSKAEHRQKMFKCLLSTTPTYHKECFARLINAFCSLREGRNYIASSSFTVDTLIQSLNTFRGPNESFICQMVIASLQKLSLKKKMRLCMIHQRVINWLIVYIKSELAKVEKEKLSDGEFFQFNPYLMEYGWALLMNLCLHEEAWESCNANGSDILTCAANMLLSIPRKDLAPYVVSTLYSILRSPDMFTLAKSMRIENTFAPLLKNDNDIGQHLNQLISLLYMKGCDRITSSRETNYDDDENPDPDVLEPELELPESWTNSLSDKDLTGDDLLLRTFLQKNLEAVLPAPPGKSTEQAPGVLVRPVTPSSLPSTADLNMNDFGKPKRSVAASKTKVNSSASGHRSSYSSASGTKVKGSSHKTVDAEHDVTKVRSSKGVNKKSKTPTRRPTKDHSEEEHNEKNSSEAMSKRKAGRKGGVGEPDN